MPACFLQRSSMGVLCGEGWAVVLVPLRLVMLKQEGWSSWRSADDSSMSSCSAHQSLLQMPQYWSRYWFKSYIVTRPCWKVDRQRPATPYVLRLCLSCLHVYPSILTVLTSLYCCTLTTCWAIVIPFVTLYRMFRLICWCRCLYALIPFCWAYLLSWALPCDTNCQATHYISCEIVQNLYTYSVHVMCWTKWLCASMRCCWALDAMQTFIMSCGMMFLLSKLARGVVPAYVECVKCAWVSSVCTMELYAIAY